MQHTKIVLLNIKNINEDFNIINISIKPSIFQGGFIF